MPIINIYSPQDCNVTSFYSLVAEAVSKILNLPSNRVWIFWTKKSIQEFYKEDWINNDFPAPVFLINCREIYTKSQLSEVINSLVNISTAALNCNKKEIFISFNRVYKGELYSFGGIWE
jgi:phenylpyruvate tautomerase PptA (4-oxalocrotonate tautomerase family)